MPTEAVYILTIGSTPPVVVAVDDPTLIGQVALDYAALNPTVPEFALSLRPGTLETPDV